MASVTNKLRLMISPKSWNSLRYGARQFQSAVRGSFTSNTILSQYQQRSTGAHQWFPSSIIVPIIASPHVLHAQSTIAFNNHIAPRIPLPPTFTKRYYSLTLATLGRRRVADTPSDATTNTTTTITAATTAAEQGVKTKRKKKSESPAAETAMIKSTTTTRKKKSTKSTATPTATTTTTSTSAAAATTTTKKKRKSKATAEPAPAEDPSIAAAFVGHSNQAFYAVRVGRNPGIYRTWQDCFAQVYRFSNAVFKKFRTLKEAKAFMNNNNTPPRKRAAAKQRTSVHNDEDDDKDQEEDEALLEKDNSKRIVPDEKYLVVHTDGACTANGREGAVAGIGVYFGKGDKRNLSESLPAGKQTNQRAELTAAIRALEIVDKDQPLEIRTDSLYVIKGATEWSKQWIKNGWKRYVSRSSKRAVEDESSEGNKKKRKTSSSTKRKAAEPKAVLNADLFQRLVALCEARPVAVKWTYVPGHKGIEGNQEADALARLGASLGVPALSKQPATTKEVTTPGKAADDSTAQAASLLEPSNATATTLAAAGEATAPITTTTTPTSRRTKKKKVKEIKKEDLMGLFETIGEATKSDGLAGLRRDTIDQLFPSDNSKHNGTATSNSTDNADSVTVTPTITITTEPTTIPPRPRRGRKKAATATA